MEMEVYPLHKNKELTTFCAEILNQQWPRSMGARLHSLSKSCDTLPVSLAFVRCKDVIGFSKLSAVQGKQNSCLLESVVIRKSDRGKGLGRTLMELTEKYAKRVGMSTIYLNTIDKEAFYSHLGYTNCKPVISLGENAHLIPESMLQHFMAEPFPDRKVQSVTSICDDAEDINCSNNCHKLDTLADASTTSLNGITSNNEKKPLSQASMEGPSPTSQATPSTATSPSSAMLSPAPPPPPPLPTSPPRRPKMSTLSVKRLDPNQVIWMKKDIA